MTATGAVLGAIGAGMERYLGRLLPTLCVMRHELQMSLDSLADSTLGELSTKHLAQIRLLKENI